MNILENLLEKSKNFALLEAERTKVPSPFHVTYTYEVGQKLAIKLGANTQIVAIGTYLMDCMLGQAFTQGKQAEHVAMSAEKTSEILSKISDIDRSTKSNILACVTEHHGVEQFSTLESEICCNADCYKFASIEGFIGGIHHGRIMPITDLLKLYEIKATEKWQALTLPICKQELEPQYQTISNLIKKFHESTI